MITLEVQTSTSIDDAFNADQVNSVSPAYRMVAIPGLINLDLADVRRVMTNAGVCHMGIGRASGESRASVAVKQAISSPLLDTTIEGARGVILNFTGGRNMKLHEIDDAASVVRDAVSGDADIIVGAVIDPTLEDEIMITVIASHSKIEPVRIYLQLLLCREIILRLPVFANPFALLRALLPLSA